MSGTRSTVWGPLRGKAGKLLLCGKFATKCVNQTERVCMAGRKLLHLAWKGTVSSSSAIPLAMRSTLITRMIVGLMIRVRFPALSISSMYSMVMPTIDKMTMNMSS